MSPRSRKRKRRSAKRTAQPPKLVKRPYGFEWVPSQFEGMTVEEIDKKLRDIGQEHQQKYEQSFQKLQEEIIKWDPLYLLSASAFYSTFDSYPGMQGTSHRVRILQHHLELLQGLVLRNKKELYSTNFPPPQVIGSIRVLLDESSKSFPLRRFATLDSSLSEEERHRLFLLDEIRGHTQAVRNWGYPQQVKRIVTDLFAPLDDSVEKVLGVRVRNLIEMWFDISKLVVGRVQSHINKFAPIQGAKSVKEAVKIFYAVKPETASSPEDMITFLKQQGLNLQQTRYFLLSYSDRWLSEIFSIALSDFVSSYPSHVDEVDLRKILNIWAFSFGDLAKENPEHFFLGNPVWRAPLIELENDRYFLPIPGLFLSFALELFEDLIRGIPDLLARYERRRAKFLEDEIERLFMSVFPSAKVYRGSLWDDPNTQKQFENDVLALIDSYQIIVEAKSGRVSAPALRGAAGRLENEIKDLIIDPSLQAKRFAQYLEDNRGKHRFQTLRGVLNEVDNTDCRETIRLNVTLDILANVQARWGDLRRAGFIPEDVDIGITLSLADLDLVFDLLDKASERIHYLARRFEFEHNAHYIADETDLIAFYIDNGFNIGEAEYNGTAIVIYGMSEILAPYYMSIWTGEKVQKPTRPYTKWWKLILDRIDKQPIDRWSEIGYMLLSLSYEEQQFFERNFQRIRRNVSRNKPIKRQGNAYIMLSGPIERRNAVVGLAYRSIQKQKRDSMMAEAVLPAFQTSAVTSKAAMCGHLKTGHRGVAGTSGFYAFVISLSILISATLQSQS